MTLKVKICIPLILAFFSFVAPASSVADGGPKTGFRLGTGLMWAPEDEEDIDGRRLYRQHYPFFVELFYGRAIKGVFGLEHFFSQEKEHTAIDSLGEQTRFTPKMRQYAVHLGIQASQSMTASLWVYGGLGVGVFWRSYNPGWKDKSYWDKARPAMLGRVGMGLKVGPKAWVGVGWRYYAVGWRQETRWHKGEFNRLRRISIFALTMSYYP